MLFSSDESIKERIVRLLLKKDQSVKSLLVSLRDENIVITIQAIYKTLRILIKDEIVLKRKTLYSLSQDWRNKVVYELTKTNNPLNLSEGEKINFYLTSLIHLDQQWKNIVLPIQDLYNKYPVFLYNPHEIWPYLSDSRRESESMYYKAFVNSKRYVFQAVGGSASYDKLAKKELENDFIQICIGEKYFPETDYPTICGDYIITTKLSDSLANEIEKCYSDIPDKSLLEHRLRKIGIEKKKVRLIIERDREKAKKMRKKMSKHFYIPHTLVSEFDLF